MAIILAELEKQRQAFRQYEEHRESVIPAARQTITKTAAAASDNKSEEKSFAEKWVERRKATELAELNTAQNQPTMAEQMEKARQEANRQRLTEQLTAAGLVVGSGIDRLGEMGSAKAARSMANNQPFTVDDAYKAQVSEAVNQAVTPEQKSAMQRYAEEAELTRAYLDARTQQERQEIYARLLALQRQKPTHARVMDRVGGAVGGGIAQLEAGVAKALNPTDRGGAADKVLRNVEEANVRGKLGLSKVGGVAYDAAQMLATNAAALAAGGVTGAAAKGVTLGLMGAATGGSSIREAQEAGASDAQAVAAGVANAVAEMAFEYLPLDNLFKMAKGEAKGIIKNNLGTYVAAMARQAGIEAGTEAATTVAQNVTDLMFYEKELNPDMSLTQWWKNTGSEALYSALLGGIVGGTMGAPAAVMGVREQQRDAAVPDSTEAPAAAAPLNENNAVSDKQNGEVEQVATAGANEAERAGNEPLAGQDAIRNYINYAVEYGNKEGKIPKQQEFLSFAKVKTSVGQVLSNLFGQDVSGYSHALRDNDIRHLLKSPGITAMDIANIPNIIENYDVIFRGNQTSDGKNTVYYVQRHNGTTYYLEQAITDKKILAPKQMKKVPSASIPKFVDKLKLPIEEIEEIKQKLTALSSSQRTDVPAQTVPGEHALNAVSNFDNAVNNSIPDSKKKDNNNINEMSLLPLAANPTPQAGATNGASSSVDNSITDSGQNSNSSINVKLENIGVQGLESAADEQTPAQRENEARRGTNRSLSAEQQRAAEVAERLGVGLRWEKVGGFAGQYDEGVISIDREAGQPVRQVLVHELTHHIESSGYYAALADHVERYIGGRMKLDAGAMQRDLAAEYAAAGVELDEDGARRELVAKFCEQMLFTDEAAIERLANTEQSLFRKIYGWVQDMLARLRGTAAEAELRRIEKLYIKAAHSTGSEDQGKVRYSIIRDADGKMLVDVDTDILDGVPEKDIPGVLSDVIQNKFHNLIEANGQQIGVNQKTAKEWQWSKSARTLYKDNRQAYDDKIRAFDKADELLTASRDYIGEKARHHNYKEFARGKVDFRVGANDYFADVVVGISGSGRAYLYDLVNIGKKKAAEVVLPSKNISVTETIGPTSATIDSISDSGQKGNPQNKKRTTKWLQGLGLQLPSDTTTYGSDESITNASQEGKRKTQKSLGSSFEDLAGRQRAANREEAELLAEDIIEDARERVTAENIQKDILAEDWAGYPRSEFCSTVIENFGVMHGRRSEARERINDWARDIVSAGEVQYWKVQEMADYLYAIGGMRDDSYAKDNPGLREDMDSYKIYVPQDVRSYLGGLKAIRKETKLRLRVKRAEGVVSIDEAYDALQEQYGYGSFPELDNQTAKLQQMLAVRERLEPTWQTWAQADDHFDTDSRKRFAEELEKEAKKYLEKHSRKGRQKQKQTESPLELAAVKTILEDKDLPDVEPMQFARAVEMKDPKNGGALRNRDLSRVLDVMAGKNRELREWLKATLETPFYEAKRLYAQNVAMRADELKSRMDALGIKKGSDESAAVQWIGEGQRPPRKHEMMPYSRADYETDLAELETEEKNPLKVAAAKRDMKKWLNNGQRPYRDYETVDYTMADLKKEFPESWEKIVEAEGYCRRLYDEYFDRINASLAKIYPQAEKKAEAEVYNKLTWAESCRRRSAKVAAGAKTIEGRMEWAVKELKRAEAMGNDTKVRRLKALMRTQEIARDKAVRRSKRLIQDAERAEDLATNMRIQLESGDTLSRKRLAKRQDYFHHFEEWSESRALKELITKPADIDSNLAGISEYTQPKTKWWGAMQRRRGAAYTADAVGGLVRYIPAAEFKVYIDPYIAEGRSIAKGMAMATEGSRNANIFLEWYSDWLNSLAGKTEALDRAVMKYQNRAVMRWLARINGRVRKNAIVGNIGSTVAQWFNLQNGMMYVSDPRDWAEGLKDLVEYNFRRGSARELQEQSGFLTERYLDRHLGQFDEGVKAAPGKLASFMLTFGDEQVSRLIWFAARRQAKRQGVEDVIAYADDITRRSVAGRGIGEVPLTQQNEVIKFFAPFQIEVNNAWQMMKEMVTGTDRTAGQKAGSWLRMTVVAYMMNMLAEAIRGSGVSFDLIGALQDAIDGWDDDEDADNWQRAYKFAGRLAGEVVSAMPMGAQAASMLITDEAKREEFFGEADPTRFSTGNIMLSAFSDFVTDLASGGDFSGSGTDLALSVLAPGWGGQASKTLGAAQDMGILPSVRLSTSEGLDVSWRNGSYTESGRYRFGIDTSDPVNVAKGLAFGRWATKEGQAYIEGGSKSLSKEVTDKGLSFEEAYGMSMNDYARIYSSVKDLESDEDSKGNPIQPGSKLEKAGVGKSKSLKIKEKIDRMTPGLSSVIRQKLYGEMGVSEKVYGK